MGDSKGLRLAPDRRAEYHRAMQTQTVGEGIILISDCARPIGNRDVCSALFALGVESLLVVDDDGTPWPSRQGRLWCYNRPFADPIHPTSSELQRITDFTRYEQTQGRTVGIWTGYSSLVDSTIVDAVIDAATRKPPGVNERRPQMTRIAAGHSTTVATATCCATGLLWRWHSRYWTAGGSCPDLR